MAKTQYIAALEIGSSKIVAAIATKGPNGELTVNHLESEQTSNCVHYGCIVNVENTKNSVNRIIRKLENRVNGKIKQLFVGISGRSVHNHEIELTHNLNNESAITDATITSIINQAYSHKIDGYDIVDVVPKAFFVDNDKTETLHPSGQFGSMIKSRLNLIVARHNIQINLNRVLDNDINRKRFVPTHLCVAETVLSEEEKKLGVMLVDLGAECTTVSIYKNEALVYLATLPMGGRNITRDLSTGFNVVEGTAEKVKRSIPNPLVQTNESVTVENIKSSDAIPYIIARTGEINANIFQQIAYAHLQADNLRNIVIVGGGSQLKGIAEALQKTTTTKLPVRIGITPSRELRIAPEINRPENVEIFSILVHAAKKLDSHENCVEELTYPDPVIAPTVNNNGNNNNGNGGNSNGGGNNGKNPNDQNKKKRPGFMSRMVDYIHNLMDEEKMEDDDDDDDK